MAKRKTKKRGRKKAGRRRGAKRRSVKRTTKRRAKRRSSKRLFKCPKTHNGKRVHASKGVCYVKTEVPRIPTAEAPCVKGRFRDFRKRGMTPSEALSKAKAAC